MTGATVLAITRGGEGLLIPTAKEVLQVGDVLALAGSHDAINAAKDLLTASATTGLDREPVVDLEWS
jgi:CPA2 family monovalent cation:H+ antiporter-2